MINEQIQIPKADCFDLPEGEYEATISEFKPLTRQKANGTQEWGRFLFDVKVPGMNRCNPRAGRNFEINLHAGSDLRNFLSDFLGRKFFEDHAGEGFSLACLVGKKCVVVLTHRDSSKYEKPFVMVERIKPLN